MPEKIAIGGRPIAPGATLPPLQAANLSPERMILREEMRRSGVTFGVPAVVLPSDKLLGYAMYHTEGDLNFTVLYFGQGAKFKS